MTSASELFYNRRSRYNRNSLGLGDESSVDRSVHGGNRRHVRDLADIDGSTHTRVSSQDGGGESIVVDQSSVSVNSHVNRGRLPFTRNGRLPGAVLLAKERLLKTLRTLSISRNPRRSGGLNRNEASSSSRFEGDDDDFSLVDAGDWETVTSRDSSSSHNSFWEMFIQGKNSKRPPGLSEEDMIHLQSKVFGICKEEEAEEEEGECSICLESFLYREELTCLPCGHRFHSGCLYPWILTCGDCPYCRAPIITASD